MNRGARSNPGTSPALNSAVIGPPVRVAGRTAARVGRRSVRDRGRGYVVAGKDHEPQVEDVALKLR